LLTVSSLLNSIAQAQLPKEITLENVFKEGTFHTRTVQGLRPMADGKTYVSIEMDPQSGERFVARYTYADGKMVERIVSEKDLTYNNIQLPIGTDFSPDENKIMIAYQNESIYRRSTQAYHYVFDRNTKSVTPVSKEAGKQRNATFSPDGKKVAFVRNNNLFFTDLTSGTET